jgi:hypothetical protein
VDFLFDRRSRAITKTEQLAAAFAKLEEAGKLLLDAGEERLVEETDLNRWRDVGFACRL